MPPKIFGKSKSAESKKEGVSPAKEQARRITDSDDDLSSEEERGIIIGAKEEVKSDDELSYTNSADVSEEAALAEKIKEVQGAQKKWVAISFQITEDLPSGERDLLLEQLTNATDYWNQQKELVESSEENSDVSEQLLEEYNNILEQLYKIKKRLVEATDPFKGSIKKLSLGKPAVPSIKPVASSVKPLAKIEKVLFISDTKDESSSSDEESSSSNASSDASPYSSDEEYGAKTLMRKLRDYLHGIEEKAYAINQDRTEEITKKEIKANPGIYYVSNLSGEYLDGFKKNLARRKVVAANVNGTIQGAAPAFESLAIRGLKKRMEQDHLKNPKKAAVAVTQEFEKFQTPKKLKDPSYLSRYISTAGYHKAVTEVSPDDGSPFISTSKDVKVPVEYADHPKKEDARSVAASFPGAKSSLHPKYSEQGKPKHRLIGFVAVIVHEANDYLARTKADIEKLRKAGEVSDKSSRQKNDQEIIFEKTIESANMAGYVPLVYPNLSKLKQYSSADKKLFGLEAEGRRPKAEKESPRSLSSCIKEYSIYRVNRNFQWRLAEKYVKSRNPDGELLWVDSDGRFNRFRIDQRLEGEAKKAAEKKDTAVRKLATEFKDAAPAVKTKPIQEVTPKASQHLGLAQQVEAKLKRIGDPKEDYSDDDMKDLGEILLSLHTHYIDPAVAVVPNELDQSISNDFINDPTKQHAIIAIHSQNHFVGIYLHRTADGQISIAYFDPAVSKQGQQPLHNLPVNVATILAQRFPNVPIINIGSEIQTYTTEGSATEKLNVLDNNHYGPFVLCIMTEMSKGNIRLNPDGTRKLQIKFSDGSWKDFPRLSQKQSNNFGQAIKNYHLTLLASDHGAEDDLQIDILRSLIRMPLETMSVLKSSLPKVAPKK